MTFPESIDPYGLLRGRVSCLNGRVEFALSGELDLASADALLARISVLADEHPGDVCLDLADLDFLGSTGIRALVSAHAALGEGGRCLVVRNADGAPLRALKLTQVAEVLIME